MFVLEGLVGVRVSFHSDQMAVLGPGELFGEMGFIETATHQYRSPLSRTR
ncbi:MAG: hypothetical protein ACI841_001878 [Planctomycetota bacterium]|jgi:hypothetical protein